MNKYPILIIIALSLSGTANAAKQCMPCPAGKWSNASTGSGCEDCPAGYYCNGGSKIQCASAGFCPAGTGYPLELGMLVDRIKEVLATTKASVVPVWKTPITFNFGGCKDLIFQGLDNDMCEYIYSNRDSFAGLSSRCDRYPIAARNPDSSGGDHGCSGVGNNVFIYYSK
ncbi:MAG: hypothetical protein LBI17_00490 [Rickettsiales bacterium]|jgi:hypothetical protein|nr:hypothetical protein [Rickettsiales bacterium]